MVEMKIFFARFGSGASGWDEHCRTTVGAADLVM
jgi:hypothetical protein